jgi:hydroxyethylthiazole kinase-like uncharacterized protein yjeF
LIQASPVPLVIDADGLNLIAEDPDILSKRQSPIVLTPHPGEMARLSGQSTADIQSDRIGHARSFAKQYGVVVVLKGAGTIIAQPGGMVFINPTGNPGMAAGGMGDVLTGMIAGLVCQGLPIEDAAQSGVYLHGLAADRMARIKAPVGYLATDVMDILPEALEQMLNSDNHGPWLDTDPLFYSMD